MSASAFLAFAAGLALVLYALALILAVIRMILGPTLPDRVIALDLLIAIGIGFIAAFSIASGHAAFLDVAIALGLVGFLSTVAFGRFITTRGRVGDPPSEDSDHG